MTKLIFIRHGETEVNTQGRTHTARDYSKLTKVGIEQIQKVAKLLTKMDINYIVCSDEARTIQSAKIIAKKLDLSIEIESNFKERNLGRYAGKPWSEIAEVLDKLTLEERYEYIPPEGESWKMFETRIYQAVEKLLKRSKDNNIAIISHGGVIRALIPKLLKLPREESFKYDPENGSFTIFEYDEGEYRKIKINDISHLK